MGYIKIKEKFPCGYESYIETKSIFISGEIESHDGKGCPLHGKNCPKSEGKK